MIVIQAMKNFLIEGRPGIGKTTLLCRIAELLSYMRIGGFYTKEIRENNNRVGFRIQTFSGQSGILSHISFQRGPYVGKYRVDVSQFEFIGVEALKDALKTSDLIFIDEIGKMELYSKRFQELVVNCFDSKSPVIATIMSRSHPFVDQIKSRKDVQRVEVTYENRDRLVNILIEEMKNSSLTSNI